jgi:hypothetical protein
VSNRHGSWPLVRTTSNRHTSEKMSTVTADPRVVNCKQVWPSASNPHPSALQTDITKGRYLTLLGESTSEDAIITRPSLLSKSVLIWITDASMTRSKTSQPTHIIEPTRRVPIDLPFNPIIIIVWATNDQSAKRQSNSPIQYLLQVTSIQQFASMPQQNYTSSDYRQ